MDIIIPLQCYWSWFVTECHCVESYSEFCFESPFGIKKILLDHPSGFFCIPRSPQHNPTFGSLLQVIMTATTAVEGCVVFSPPPPCAYCKSDPTWSWSTWNVGSCVYIPASAECCNSCCPSDHFECPSGRRKRSLEHDYLRGPHPRFLNVSSANN